MPRFGNWLGDGVRQIILEAYCKTNLRVQQILQQLHGNNRCIEYYPERLCSKVTRAQLHSILSSFPHESSDDDHIARSHIPNTKKYMHGDQHFAMATQCPVASN